jgi:acetyl/propionyl-CoA carboxylase alpha subunit
LRQQGHAIECRVCAEDPAQGFAPALGRIESVQLPGGPGIRVDSGLYPGMEVTRHYDSMLAKVCAHGADRSVAIARMLQALSELKIAGVATNAAFLARVLRSPAFASGRYATDVVPSILGNPPAEDGAEDLAFVAAALLEHARRSEPAAAACPAPAPQAWKLSGRPVP